MGGYVVRMRAAAALLLVGAVLAVAGSALPFLYIDGNRTGFVTVMSAWRTTVVPEPGVAAPSVVPMSQGYLLVLAALLACAAAISGLATARRDPLAMPRFGALAAGFLAAATLAFPVEYLIAPVTSLRPSPGVRRLPPREPQRSRAGPLRADPLGRRPHLDRISTRSG